jgi:hypothetical protein
MVTGGGSTPESRDLLRLPHSPGGCGTTDRTISLPAQRRQSPPWKRIKANDLFPLDDDDGSK